MDFEKLLQPLEKSFIQLGYKKISVNNWVCQTQELIIVLTVNKADTAEKMFAIGMGIIFKQIGVGIELKKISFDYHSHIVQTLFGILSSMGESEEYLDKLFSYDLNDNSGMEVKNISIIMDLYKKKIMPYIKELDERASIVSNFDKKSSWKPFLEYFVPNQFNGPFMNRFFFLLTNKVL